MTIANDFKKRNKKLIIKMSKDKSLNQLSKSWLAKSERYEYSYHFNWLGRPIIQYPQDIMAIQEIIWKVKPDLIIETGIAHGGSLIFYASILELIGSGQVLGIDVDIREHNRKEIEKHPLYKKITMIQGSSIDKYVSERVCQFAKGKRKIMVLLDSNHTHNHVLQEMMLYSPLVTKGSYMVVLDTVIDDLSGASDHNRKRPWGKDNNPKTAVREFLKHGNRFEIDKEIENKLLITVAPSGYLKCIRD